MSEYDGLWVLGQPTMKRIEHACVDGSTKYFPETACVACLTARLAEAEAAAYAGWVAATGYPIAEWVFEYHPFLKDYQPKEKEAT